MRSLRRLRVFSEGEVTSVLTDFTLKVTPKIEKKAKANLKKASAGHLGTHFDVMNKEFPLEYTRRKGIVFDVSNITGRDIDIPDIDLDLVQKDMFVVFYTGFIESEGYGTKKYFTDHPQVSNGLIDALLDKQISMIGIDFSGLRNGEEHTPTDYRCAERCVFNVENLCNLKTVAETGGLCMINTYPLNFSGWTGLPCRVVAEI